MMGCGKGMKGGSMQRGALGSQVKKQVAALGRMGVPVGMRGMGKKKPARLVKGSAAAKKFMASIRKK
jgi:hypothetical protein